MSATDSFFRVFNFMQQNSRSEERLFSSESTYSLFSQREVHCT